MIERILTYFLDCSFDSYFELNKKFEVLQL